MNSTSITITILTIILVISLIFNIVYFLQIRHKNNEIKGAYTFNTFCSAKKPAKLAEIMNDNVIDSNKVDLHLKYIMNEFCKNNNIKGSYKNLTEYDNNDLLNNESKKIIEFPELFGPDYIMELDNHYIIIECDEGGNFHSEKKNPAYVKKWLNYNNMIINDNYNDKSVVILRITYKHAFKFTELEDKIVNNIISFILGLSAVSCYYLFKFGIDEISKLVYISKKKIEENSERNCDDFYEHQNLKVADIDMKTEQSSSRTFGSTGNLKPSQSSRKLKGGEINDIIIEENGYKVYEITEEIEDLQKEINSLESYISYDLKYLYSYYDVRFLGMFINDFDENDEYYNKYHKYYDHFHDNVLRHIWQTKYDSKELYDKIISKKIYKVIRNINKYNYDDEIIRIYVNLTILLLCSVRDEFLANYAIFEYSKKEKQEIKIKHGNIFNEQIVKDFINKYEEYIIKDITDLYKYNKNNYAIE